jgi:cytochrome oxidase Cu insertion factor (SCO1/SenC/PrrC family)
MSIAELVKKVNDVKLVQMTFDPEMDKRHAEDARKIKLSSKPAWKSHMWIKGNK